MQLSLGQPAPRRFSFQIPNPIGAAKWFGEPRVCGAKVWWCQNELLPKNPGCLGYIGDEILYLSIPSYIGIIRNRYKDPY